MPTKEQMEHLRKMTQSKIRSIAIDTSKFDEATRTLTLSFASESPCMIWGDKEILIISEDAMDTSRFTQGVMPVLFNHNRDAVIASINKIWIENKKAYAEIVFDDDEDSLKIMRKVQSGSCRGVSVGYKPKTYEIVSRDAISTDGFVGPCYIARKWEVLEFSIVSVPADPSVAAGRSEDDTDNPVEIIETKKQETRDDEMTPEEKARLEAEELARKEKEKTDLENARKEAAEAERTRCSEITEICRDFEVEDSARDEFIKGGKDMNFVRAEVLKLQKERHAPTTTAKVGDTSDDKIRAAMTDAILLRGGATVAKPADGAEKFRYMRMRQMALELLENAGDSEARYLTDDELFKRALTTTGALSSILSNVAGKTLAAGYAEAGTTYRDFTTVGSLTDFKTATRYLISAMGTPKKIPAGGEFSYQMFSDEGVSVKLETEGTGFTYTREMFINDDLGVLSKAPALVSAAFDRRINQLVYAALTTSALYSSGNGNLATTAGAPSTATLSAGRAAMKKQKDISKKAYLNVVPGYIIVPTALETTAYQLLASASDPSSANAGVINAFKSALQVISDPCLDDSSADAWYLVAKKGLVDTIEVSYLNGNQTPILESGMDPDVLGWKFRAYLDFNVKALDYRGLYKNAGK